MRKRKTGRTLSRVKSQRVALLRTLLVSLIKNGKIETTLAKAKELRPFAEKKITTAKGIFQGKDKITVIRELKKSLPQLSVEQILQLAEVFKNRAGGYTRIIKLDRRKSDNAEMAIVQLVDFLKPKEEKKSAKPAKKKEETKSKK